MEDFNYGLVDENRTTIPDISVAEWIFTIIFTLLPGINLLFLIYLIVNKSVNINKKTYAKAAFILIFIMNMLLVAILNFVL